jgi:hypothetical protein
MPACRPTCLQAEIQEGELGQHACRVGCADVLAFSRPVPAAKALRDLVESVTVARDGVGIHVTINGRLDVMLGATAFPDPFTCRGERW